MKISVWTRTEIFFIALKNSNYMENNCGPIKFVRRTYKSID